MRTLVIAAVAAAVTAGAAHAGNPAAGKEKARACAACHGPDGNSAAADFPKLAGQHYDYIVKALHDYKAGERTHPSMRAIAASLNDRDMADLAAFYATEPTKSASR